MLLLKVRKKLCPEYPGLRWGGHSASATIYFRHESCPILPQSRPPTEAARPAWARSHQKIGSQIEGICPYGREMIALPSYEN